LTARVLVTNEAIFLAGAYESNRSGSSATPSANRGYIARLDFEGNQQWFQEFLLDLMPYQQTTTIPSSYAALIADSKGNPVIVVNGLGAVETATAGKYVSKAVWYVFKLNKDSGALM
jgi:hypothetical protein